MATQIRRFTHPVWKNVSPFCKSQQKNDCYGTRQLVNSFRYVDASGAEPDPLALAQGIIPVFIARKVFIFKKIGRGERI